MVVETRSTSPGRLYPSVPPHVPQHDYHIASKARISSNLSKSSISNCHPSAEGGSLVKTFASCWGDMDFPGQLPAGATIPNSTGKAKKW